MNGQSRMRSGWSAGLRWILIALGLLFLWPAETGAYAIVGKNAISGGLGFQAGLSDWTPGGFKWFNEYSRKMSHRVWLNVQLNTTVGNVENRHCWRDTNGVEHCTGGNWDGGALEMVVGPNLRFPLRRIPLIIDCKLGGAVDLLYFGRNWAGAAFAFRGGVGVHYFIMDNLGVGAKLLFTLGPSAIDDGVGLALYAAIDFQIIGIEFRW